MPGRLCEPAERDGADLSARREKVREALANLRYDTDESQQRLAALAEVEQWEGWYESAAEHMEALVAERDEALRDAEEARKLYGIFRARYEDKYTEWDAAKTNAVKDAEAEADRLKAALTDKITWLDSMIRVGAIREPYRKGADVALNDLRAALAPADRNTT